MKYLLKLVIGDFGGEGHEKRDFILIKSNLSKSNLMKAYEKGSKIIDFDLIKEIGSRYESKHRFAIELDYAKKLHSIGFDMGLDGTEDQSSEINWGPEAHFDAFLFISKLGNSNFEYEISEEDEKIYIGGYGYF